MNRWPNDNLCQPDFRNSFARLGPPRQIKPMPIGRLTPGNESRLLHHRNQILSVPKHHISQPRRSAVIRLLPTNNYRCQYDHHQP